MRDGRGGAVGTHDFSAFRAAECQAKTPVQDACDVAHAVGVNRRSRPLRLSPPTAFLHHMIRNIVGALVYVGAGQPAGIVDRPSCCAARDRTRAAPTFAADGLYFTGADYAAALRIAARRDTTCRASRPR